MIHVCLIVAFIILFLGMIQNKIKWLKFVSLGIFTVLYLTCVIDYTITIYRGIGFVKTDITKGSTLFTLLSNANFPTGKKFYISLFIYCFSLIAFLFSFGKRVNEKLLRLVVSAVFVMLIGFGIITNYPNERELFRAGKLYPSACSESGIWYEDNTAIFHALGETVDGITLTNSYNALEYNYARGVRVFETDISFTSDDVPVLRHDWDSDLGQGEAFGWSDEGFAVSEEVFVSTPIYQKYTPMTLLDLFEFMNKHKDMYIVFDTKLSADYSVSEQYEIISNLAKENNLEEVLSRVVVQLYYYSMYEEVEKVFPISNALLTMYVIGEQPYEEVYDFLHSHNLNVLTVPNYFDKEALCNYFSPKGIAVYTHTYNDCNEVIYELRNGVDGFYTDSIVPATIASLKESITNQAPLQ